MPSGSSAPEPTASRTAGTPNSISPPTPASTASTAACTQRVAGVLHDARHRRDRLRRGDALAHEHRQHQLGRVQPVSRPPAAAARGSPAAAAAARSGTPPAQPVSGRDGAADGRFWLGAQHRLARPRPPRPADPRRTRPGRRPATPRSARPPGRRPAGRAPRRSSPSPGRCTPPPWTGAACRRCPTRLRTVEDEVKTTASNEPVLIASRTGAAGGAARTVRYAVTSSTSQPISTSPATRVSVAMSARGRKTRLIGSSTWSNGGHSSSRPVRRLLLGRHQVGLDPPLAQGVGRDPADRGDLQPGERAGVEAVLGRTSPAPRGRR